MTFLVTLKHESLVFGRRDFGLQYRDIARGEYDGCYGKCRSSELAGVHPHKMGLTATGERWGSYI